MKVYATESAWNKRINIRTTNKYKNNWTFTPLRLILELKVRIYIRGGLIMKSTEEKALSQEIDKQIEKAAAELSAVYPGQDVKMMIMERLLKERGTEIRRSEIDRFKEQAISTLGTDHEIAFNDAERGFLQAALSDGRMGFKEFMESIPVETPLREDGTKMANAGAQKKT